MVALKDKKTVAIVDASVARTGGLVGARNIARALKESAAVIIILPSEATPSEDDLKDFAAVYRLPIANLRRSMSGVLFYLPKLVASSWSLNRELRRSKCQHLILNDFYLMHGAVCRLLGYRGHIVSWVRIDPMIFGGILARTWLRIAKWSSNDFVVVSRYIASKIARFTSARLIYDPLARSSRSREPGQTSARRRLVFVGNYIYGKGQDDALEAFARIAESFPDAELAFFGGDMGLAKNRAFRLSLQERADQLGLNGRVIFHDFAKDPSVALANAYLCLNFSRNEAFSMTVLEASGGGLPVIATRCGGPEEIIEDGVTGLLVPVADVAAMSEAMGALLDDPYRAASMGRAGRHRVAERFSSEQFKRELFSVLEL